MASGVLEFTNGGKGVVSLKATWHSTPNPSRNSSTVDVTLTIKASASGNCLQGSHLTINGVRKNFNQYLNHPHGGPTITLCANTIEVPHNGDGTKSIDISAALVWNGYLWNGSGVNVSTISGSGTVTLDRINTKPPNPSSISVSGLFENGSSQTININGSGPKTGYNIFYRFWNKINNQYSSWNYHGFTDGNSYTIHHNGITWDCIQYAVATVNHGIESDRIETAWYWHYGVRVNNNGMVRGRIKVWNGSSWVDGYIRIWNGSSWVLAN
jgi:hypothetical protein